MDKLYFPLFIDLHGKDILFIGGGTIATRRIKAILPFADAVRVVAREFSEELKKLAESNAALSLEERDFNQADIKNAFLVLACTDDRELNEKVAKACKERGIWVNDCSEKENSSFFFPGLARREEVVAAVCASGKDHKKAAAYRKKLQEFFDEMK